MTNKQRFFLRLIIAVIFVIGGGVYLFNGELIYAIAFIVAGALFAYNAIKTNKNNEE